MPIMHYVQSEKKPTTVHANGQENSLFTLLVHMAFIDLSGHKVNFALIDNQSWQCLINK